MRIHLLLLAALLAAGCAAPSAPPTPTTPSASGPVDLTGKAGLLAVDTTTRQVTLLSTYDGFGWMSPNASYVTWLDDGYSVLLVSATNEREVVAGGSWARIFDNGTGLELRPRLAVWHPLNGRGNASSTPLPEAPHLASRWTDASSDLSVLGAEYAPSVRGEPCRNELFVRGPQSIRSIGCQLRIADDGRAAWTEASAVRVMARDGAVTNLTTPSLNATTIAQNPVFTADGIVYVRVNGTAQPTRMEVVREDGTVLAVMDGPRKLTLHDVSRDGRFVLARVFEGSAS